MSKFYDEDVVDVLEQETREFLVEDAHVRFDNQGLEFLTVVLREDNKVEIDVWARDFPGFQGILLNQEQVHELADSLATLAARGNV